MYKFLAVLNKESEILEYKSTVTEGIFGHKKMFINPVTLIVDASSVDEAEDEVLALLYGEIEFKDTILETKALKDLKSINRSNGYILQAVVKLED